MWNRTEFFFGTPFVWNMLHNYGGRRFVISHPAIPVYFM